MNYWLVKSDPEEYSAADLARDHRTVWDGVTNALAQRHLRAMRKGDPVMIYHSGKEKAVVALAKVASDPRPDPSDKSGKLAVVELAFDRTLKKPVGLTEIKADSVFESFNLVRISRLSIMPVSASQWARLMEMSR